jgi:hypothetical protein
VRVNVVREVGRDQQVAPISLSELEGVEQALDIAATQAQRSEPKTLETFRRLRATQVVRALLGEQRLDELYVFWREHLCDMTFGERAQFDHVALHASGLVPDAYRTQNLSDLVETAQA